MNNNRSDERAILAGCKGVFAPASYISIGTKGWAPTTDELNMHDIHNHLGYMMFSLLWSRWAQLETGSIELVQKT